MGWRAKAHFLAITSRTPGGRAAYRYYQDRQASRMADADEMLTRALDLLGLYRESGGDPRDRDCLEIGTGWCPWVPLLLAVSGARRIVTFDINPWLSLKTAIGTTNALRNRVGRVAAALQRTEREILPALEKACQATTLDEWLSAVHVTYRCEDLCAAALPAETFDVIFSSNVLEHVSAKALSALHRESWRLLRDGGRVVHRFNPQDHFSVGDCTITGANFLQYSQKEWQWLGGSGLSYHNRLRCPQHRELIISSGLDVVLARTRQDARARHAIESGALRVHRDFAGFDPAALTDDYMWIVAEKGPQADAHPTGSRACFTGITEEVRA
jgi:SAM-dependent methyltransferase